MVFSDYLHKHVNNSILQIISTYIEKQLRKKQLHAVAQTNPGLKH